MKTWTNPEVEELLVSLTADGTPRPWGEGGYNENGEWEGTTWGPNEDNDGDNTPES